MQPNLEKTKKPSSEIRKPIHFIKHNLKEDLIGVEVGVYKGEHAKQMLDFLSLKKLYLVDNWKHNRLVLENGEIRKHSTEKTYIKTTAVLKKYSNIEIIIEQSIKAAQNFKDKTLDFVYIDGCHNCDSVFSDIYIWERKIKKGGVLCGHDYHWYGVKDAIKIYLKINSRKLRTYNSVRGDWWWVVP